MNAQLIHKDGTMIELNDVQYEQILGILHLFDQKSPMSPEEIEVYLDEIEAMGAGLESPSTDDLLAERALEREAEKRKENRLP